MPKLFILCLLLVSTSIWTDSRNTESLQKGAPNKAILMKSHSNASHSDILTMGFKSESGKQDIAYLLDSHPLDELGRLDRYLAGHFARGGVTGEITRSDLRLPIMDDSDSLESMLSNRLASARFLENGFKTHSEYLQTLNKALLEIEPKVSKLSMDAMERLESQLDLMHQPGTILSLGAPENLLNQPAPDFAQMDEADISRSHSLYLIQVLDQTIAQRNVDQYTEVFLELSELANNGPSQAIVLDAFRRTHRDGLLTATPLSRALEATLGKALKVSGASWLESEYVIEANRLALFSFIEPNKLPAVAGLLLFAIDLQKNPSNPTLFGKDIASRVRNNDLPWLKSQIKEREPAITDVELDVILEGLSLL